MPLPVPNLDDRDFAQLLAEAKALIPVHCPAWTDLSPGDPGITLLELFAFLTDTMLYRLNRLPEKAFVQFLNLMGVQLQPPAAARVDLTFTLRGASNGTGDGPANGSSSAPAGSVTVPRGTRVSTAGSGQQQGPVFTTTDDVVLTADQPAGTVAAVHGDLVEGELLGTGTGLPGQSLRVARPPVVLDSGELSDLVIGVEADPAELEDRAPSVLLGGTTYRVWTEVAHFGGTLRAPGDGSGGEDADRYVYVVDRAEGRITFAPAVQQIDPHDGLERAPALLARVPGPGRRVLASYRHGGGAGGNVRAGTLTVLKDPVPGVDVTNATAATGGREAETLENALLRGPQALHTLDRVVTARDYELLAVAASGGVARARALTRASLWEGAPAGQVQLLLVPSLEPARVLTADAAEIAAQQSAETIRRVREAVAERSLMTTGTEVGWTGLKQVRIVARVVVHQAEDRAAVRDRLDERLRRALSPLPVDGRPGWAFGEALRASTVYDVLLAERGVRYVEGVRIVVEDVPSQVSALSADPHEPSTWYCGSDERVFRTVDDAQGWELLATFPGQRVERVAPLPGSPGTLVLAAGSADGSASTVHVSQDYGETWQLVTAPDFHVEDVAPALADGVRIAFLATDRGLLRQELVPEAAPVPLLIDAAQSAMPCYAVQAIPDPAGGGLRVAVAAQVKGGVYVSFQAGRSGTFQPTGLKGVDVRVLREQQVGPRRFVVAGAYATGSEEGDGVHRLELRGPQPDPQGWSVVGAGWTGGSCLDLACIGEVLIAGTSRAGVTVSDPTTVQGAWRSPATDSGLPSHEQGRFDPVRAVAATPVPLVLAGGPSGVFLSHDAATWEKVSEQSFSERVTLPPTWLFASGQHELEVVYDGARG